MTRLALPTFTVGNNPASISLYIWDRDSDRSFAVSTTVYAIFWLGGVSGCCMRVVLSRYRPDWNWTAASDVKAWVAARLLQLRYRRQDRRRRLLAYLERLAAHRYSVAFSIAD